MSTKHHIPRKIKKAITSGGLIKEIVTLEDDSLPSRATINVIGRHTKWKVKACRIARREQRRYYQKLWRIYNGCI